MEQAATPSSMIAISSLQRPAQHSTHSHAHGGRGHFAPWACVSVSPPPGLPP